MTSSAQFYVSEVPTLPNAATQFQLYAGDLPSRPSSGQQQGQGKGVEGVALYFQLHRARHTSQHRRLIIWFNGGPGCSSLDGVMMEVGAWRTKLDATLEWAPDGAAWNEYADVLFCTSGLFIA